MNIDIADVLFYVGANLGAGERAEIENDLQGCDGVLSAHFVRNQPHMLEVAYNPATLTAGALREHLGEHGLQVHMSGL